MTPTRSTASDNMRANSYSNPPARPACRVRKTLLTRVLYVMESREGISPGLIFATTLKSDVPARLPDLIDKSRRIQEVPLQQAAQHPPHHPEMRRVQLWLCPAIDYMNWLTIAKCFFASAERGVLNRLVVLHQAGTILA